MHIDSLPRPSYSRKLKVGPEANSRISLLSFTSLHVTSSGRKATGTKYLFHTLPTYLTTGRGLQPLIRQATVRKDGTSTHRCNAEADKDARLDFPSTNPTLHSAIY